MGAPLGDEGWVKSPRPSQVLIALMLGAAPEELNQHLLPVSGHNFFFSWVGTEKFQLPALEFGGANI